MKTYIIDFDAWTKIQATDENEAMSIGQTIINIIDEALANEGFQLSMVVRDGGIEEQN